MKESLFIPAAVQIREGSWLARLAAWKLGAGQVALTLGKTIHLHRTRKEDFLADQRWFRHEMKHIEQFHRYGFFAFVLLYLMESLFRGYYKNRFEVEARAAE